MFNIPTVWIHYIFDINTSLKYLDVYVQLIGTIEQKVSAIKYKKRKF